MASACTSAFESSCSLLRPGRSGCTTSESESSWSGWSSCATPESESSCSLHWPASGCTTSSSESSCSPHRLHFMLLAWPSDPHRHAPRLAHPHAPRLPCPRLALRTPSSCPSPGPPTRTSPFLPLACHAPRLAPDPPRHAFFTDSISIPLPGPRVWPQIPWCGPSRVVPIPLVWPLACGPHYLVYPPDKPPPPGVWPPFPWCGPLVSPPFGVAPKT